MAVEDDAIAGAREIQKQRPKDPVGFMVESEIRVVQQQWDPAITAMRALANGPVTIG